MESGNMIRHLAFLLYIGLVLLVWFPAYLLCENLVCQLILVVFLVILLAMFVEVYYDMNKSIHRRQLRKKLALDLIEHFQRTGHSRYSCYSKARFTPEEGLSFVED
jgi:hypothetical protein